MDTVYYHVNARRVKVSGGADLVTFQPVSLPAPGETKGEVLDFARCRQRLETKAAWRELAQAADGLSGEEGRRSPAQSALSRRERAAGWLELCASAAVIAVSLAAVAAFLGWV